ncbi:MAG: hypothetical protein R2684_02605 [Pyrinomonadaceae bacterium]
MESIVVRTEQEANEAIERLAGSMVLGCDTETSGLSPSKGKLLSVQFSDGELGCLVPVSEGVSLDLFRPLFDDGDISKAFHNAKFDLSFLAASGISVNNVFDTMIAEKVLTRGADQSVSLAETLYRYFAVDLDKGQRKKFGRAWDGKWSEELVQYALGDVFYLPELVKRQIKWLEDLGLTEEYEEKALRAVSSFEF